MENTGKETFSYTYSAKEQEEIKAIRQKYSPVEEQEDKLSQLRRLDASVTKKAQGVSLTLGIIGALVLGIGMSLTMSNLGEILSSYEYLAMPLGIVIGIAGIALVCAAYPLYNRIVKKERARLAPEILRLADDLLQ